MAYPFRAILSPIQFDDPSLLGLGFAKSIAEDLGATLHLLHVVPMVPAIGEAAVSAAMHRPALAGRSTWPQVLRRLLLQSV